MRILTAVLRLHIARTLFRIRVIERKIRRVVQLRGTRIALVNPRIGHIHAAMLRHIQSQTSQRIPFPAIAKRPQRILKFDILIERIILRLHVLLAVAHIQRNAHLPTRREKLPELHVRVHIVPIPVLLRALLHLILQPPKTRGDHPPGNIHIPKISHARLHRHQRCHAAAPRYLRQPQLIHPNNPALRISIIIPLPSIGVANPHHQHLHRRQRRVAHHRDPARPIRLAVRHLRRQYSAPRAERRVAR